MAANISFRPGLSMSRGGSFSEISFGASNIRKNHEELVSALENMKNPFVVEALVAKFRALAEGVFDSTEEFASTEFFEGLYLPIELKEAVEKLSHEVYVYCLSGTKDVRVLKQRIEQVKKMFCQIAGVKNRNRARTLAWGDLAAWLKQPEMQSLSLEHLDLIFEKIEKKEKPEDIIGLLEKFLGEGLFTSLESHIEESGDDLFTLVDEIRNNKPKEEVVNDISSLWDQSEMYFRSKTLKLEHGGSGTNVQGPIVTCEKEDDVWYFQLGDHCRTEVEVRRDKAVFIAQSQSYRLGHCLNSGLIPQGKQVNLEHGEKQLDSLPEGIYAFSLDSVKEKKDQIAIHLSKLEGPKVDYVLHCTKDPDRGDIVEVELNQNGKISELPIDLFYRIQLTIKEKKRIDLEDPKRQCTFLEVAENAEQTKSFQLQKIQQELSELKKQLLSDRILLDQFLDSYIATQCKTADTQLTPEKWREELENISEKYSQYINQPRSVSDLLTQLMLEANYESLVQRRNNVQTRHIMELLRESQERTRELRGKDMVLFVGNTGAGKSTLITYLLGGKLKLEENLGGEGCFVSEGDTKCYPKIGRGLGTSETVFAQGFPIEEGSTTVLCDLPGFNDTRGGEHVLCTNLTLDQAISQARSIRSIVLTIPVQAFWLDRGGGVVALVERVRERFLGIMEPEKIDAVPHYVVLTKSEHVQPGFVEALLDGSRFEELRREIQEEIDKEGSKAAPNILRIQGLERLRGIWQAFLSLCERKAIEAPSLQNKKRSKLLIKKYTDPVKQVPKSQYISAMNTPGMKRQFGEMLELSTSSWSNIFEKYLVKLPEKIARYESSIMWVEREMNRLNEDFKEIDIEIEVLSKKKQEIEKINASREGLTEEIQEMNRLNEDFKAVDIEIEVLSKKKQEIEKINASRIDELKCALRWKEQRIEALDQRIGNIELWLDEKRAEIQKCEAAIKNSKATHKFSSSRFLSSIGLRGANDDEEQAIILARAAITKLKEEIETYQEEIRLQKEAIHRDEEEIAALTKAMQENLENLVSNEKKRVRQQRILEEQAVAIEVKRVRQQWILEEQAVAIEGKKVRQQEISQKIEELRQKLEEDQIAKSVVEKKKRHFAVLIHSEWETARVLRDLIEMIMNSGNEGEQVLQKTSFEECRRFVEFYDKKASEVREKVHQELEIVA